MPVQLTSLSYVTVSIFFVRKTCFLTEGRTGEVTWKEFTAYYPPLPVRETKKPGLWPEFTQEKRDLLIRTQESHI